MDTALPQKFPFIQDWNLAKANCTENQVCTSSDTVFLVDSLFRAANKLYGLIHYTGYPIQNCKQDILYDFWGCIMAESIACLLTETGDAGSSPKVAKRFFQ